MPSSLPAIAFVWADDASATLDAELSAWFVRRRRPLRAPATTRYQAFVAARPLPARGARK